MVNCTSCSSYYNGRCKLLGEFIDTQGVCDLYVEQKQHNLEDSGNRTKFDTGAVRDIHEGKGRFDLIPLNILSKIYHHCFGDEPCSDILSQIGLFKESGNIEFLYRCLDFFFKSFVSDTYMFILDLAKHYEQGALKYGEHNWEKGIPLHSYMDSALRHLHKHLNSMKDERHDVAFVWNIIGAIWTMSYKPELDDFCDLHNLSS